MTGVSTQAAIGWANKYLPALPAGPIDMDPANTFGVTQVLARYAFALDAADLPALASVLTEDAVWSATVGGAVRLGPWAGRPAILDLVRTTTREQTDQRRHNLTNILFHGANESEAVVSTYLTLTSNGKTTPRVVATGFVTFTLRREENQWRIAKLLVGLDNPE